MEIIQFTETLNYN